MKTRRLFLLAVLAGLGLMPPARLVAQTLTNIYNFSAYTRVIISEGPVDTNSDGTGPNGSLILSGNTLYGLASGGGVNGCGTLYALNTNSPVFTTPHIFSTVSATDTNGDGAFPTSCSLASFGGILYGMATYGGLYGYGSLFSVSNNGTGFTVLRMFNNIATNGAGPESGLILSSNTLYGTTQRGGQFLEGTVFSISTNGTAFAILHNFTNAFDGGNPVGGVVLAGNRLYGTAETGGSNFYGTVFALNTTNGGFTVLHTFNNVTNNGAYSVGGLVLSGGTLYGTTEEGGTNLQGTVFALSTNGTGFTILHSFTGGNDGGLPEAGLLLSGGLLYGTTAQGGFYGDGVAFAIGTNGSGFTVLHTFAGNNVFPYDGGSPATSLVSFGNTFFGTAGVGLNSSGVIFSLAVPVPQLDITLAARTNVILTWTTNASAFTLESTTNLLPPSVWNTVLPAPAIVNGQNTVTNPVTGKQTFYRLNL